MQYKTIVLELLRERTELHEQLRQMRRLLPILEACARQLRESHLQWTAKLVEANPGSDPIQLTSEAIEFATRELEDHLPPVSEEDEQDPLSLDEAMAFIRRMSKG